jgi:uncharacterized membrane protein
MQRVESFPQSAIVVPRRPELDDKARERRASAAWVGLGLGFGATVALVLLRNVARGSRARTLGAASAAVAGATLLDTLYLVRKRKGAGALNRGITVRTSVTIRRSREDVYRYWRELRNLPVFMRHLDSVTETDGHSVWRTRGPAGVRLEWEAEIVADKPSERIAWRSLEGARIPNHGSVEFRDAPREAGTEVHFEVAFEPPGGAIGTALTRLFDEVPEQSMKTDLHRLKQLMETGEVVCSDASIHRGLHPARPPKLEELPLVNGMVKS